MPGVLETIVISAGALFVGSAPITLGTLLQIGMTIGGIVSANRARQDATAAYNASLRDKTVSIRSAEAARRIIYGQARVGGVIVYGCNSGTKNEYLHLVLALAGHPVTGIDDIWLADKSIGTLDGSGNVSSTSIAWAAKNVTETYSTTVPASPYIVTLPYATTAIQSVVTTQVDSENNYEPIPYTYTSSTQITLTAASEGLPIVITYTRDAGESKLQVVKFLGAAARDIPLETASAGKWTAAHLGNGIARIRATFKPDLTTFPNGLQNISAIVRGKAVYDPRTGTTAYSENSALCILDYLMSSAGFKASLAEIDTASFIAAANICDEDVPLGGGLFQKRYVCGGVLTEDADRIENLRALLSSMGGEVAYIAGKWYVRAGAYYTPSITLDDGDFADGDMTIVANTPRRSLYNAVKGRCTQPDALWSFTDFTPYASDTYAAEDGGETIWADIDLPMTTNPIRAQRLSKLQLFKSRQSLIVEAEFKLKALAITPLTTIRIKNVELGWDTIDGGLGKLFVVRDRKFNPDRMTVTLSLQEEASAVYAWDYSEGVNPNPSPNTDLRDPRDVDPIAGLTVTSSASTYRILKDGTIVPYALLTWTAQTDSLVTEGGNIRVAWKRALDTRFESVLLPGDASRYFIDGIGPGEILNIGVQAINAAQVQGQWSWTTHTASAALLSNAQSPRFGLGVNLLANSAFKAGIPGWTAYGASGYTASVSLTLGANGAPKPFGALNLTVPSGAIGTDIGEAVGDGLRIPCSPGQRIEAQLKVQNFRANARIRVEFLDAAGSVINWGISGGVAATTADSAVWSQSLADFTLLWGFASVPAGAAQCQLAIYMARTSTSAASIIYGAQPYLGIAHAQQSLPSPWTDGPPRGALAIADLATTSLIAPNAATETSQVTGSTTSYTTGTTAPGTTLISICSITATNPSAQAAIITLFGRGEFSLTPGGSFTSSRWGGMYITSSAEGATIPTGEPISGYAITTVASARSLEPSRRFSLAAGATETYTMYMALDPDLIGVTTKPVLRYEMIKR